MKSVKFGAFTSLVVVLVLLVGLVIAGLVAFNNARNGVISRESALTAQYANNQNELSAYVSTVKESMGVANVSAESVNTIISNAIQGRYSDENGGVVNGEAHFVVNAVAEAYPDVNLTVVNYQNVQVAISSGREAFKNQQAKLLDMIREYDTWRQSGIIHSVIVSWVGAPTDGLKAKVGGEVLTGQAALDKMQSLVLSDDAIKSFETGVDGGVNTGDMGPSFENKESN